MNFKQTGRGHITDQTVSQIRFELFNNCRTTEEVSRQLGVSRKAVSKLKNGVSHISTFTRFINNQPVNVIVDPDGQEGQFQNWLRQKASRYKMTFERLYEMVAKSGGNYEICESQLVLGPVPVCGRKNATTLCIDHDHKTGAPRGILCACCNLVIGRYETQRIKDKIIYLGWRRPV
jgi:hypothetical protein